MASQLAIEALDAGRVIAKINDPVRAAAYAELGIATLCRTGLMVDAIDTYLGLPLSGLSGLHPPTGHHVGSGHLEGAGNAAAPRVAAPSATVSTSSASAPAAPSASAPSATTPAPTATQEV
jgi:hypothetical protein